MEAYHSTWSSMLPRGKRRLPVMKALSACEDFFQVQVNSLGLTTQGKVFTLTRQCEDRRMMAVNALRRSAMDSGTVYVVFASPPTPTRPCDGAPHDDTENVQETRGRPGRAKAKAAVRTPMSVRRAARRLRLHQQTLRRFD